MFIDDLWLDSPLIWVANCMIMVAQRLLPFDILSQICNDGASTCQAVQPGHCISNCDGEDDAFMKLALSSIGSRWLQTVMGDVPGTKLLQWQRICLQHALRLTEHRHGNFVVAKLVQVSSPSFCSRFCVALAGHVCRLARHQCGSRILERIMEHCCSCQIDAWFAEVVSHSATIVGNKYGNYVIQHLFEVGPQHWCRRCLVELIKSARRVGHAGCYFRCALAYIYERTNDEYILRILLPLRQQFLNIGSNTNGDSIRCVMV